VNQEEILNQIKQKIGSGLNKVSQIGSDEVYLEVEAQSFKPLCLFLHRTFSSPVMAFFACDERKTQGHFELYCTFVNQADKTWYFVQMQLSGENAEFDTIANDIYSANLFEREMKEQFGVDPIGNPDARRLALHDEVWPQGSFPLRKDFKGLEGKTYADYIFDKVEGEGIFEVPVGPVHAGIIGPGHFHFSAAGEPIINLEIRLGYSHRGVEKLMEGKTSAEALVFSERVAGDSAVAHSWAFCQAVEKICGTKVPPRALYIRSICLELERLYNHASTIGGIALDVGFSFPAALATIIKENVQVAAEQLCGSRFLRGSIKLGGVGFEMDASKELVLKVLAEKTVKDLADLKSMLFGSVAFLDRVETTGTLWKKTAEDLGVVGLVARSSGLSIDFRDKTFPYQDFGFKVIKEQTGDVLARLKSRFKEMEESLRLIKEMLAHLPQGEIISAVAQKIGFSLGVVEGWRGPVLYWIKLEHDHRLERAKIVDPSFHNWPSLGYSVIGDIIPDFPVCNKSFDLAYAGNDL